jgi:hypothetical protein
VGKSYLFGWFHRPWCPSLAAIWLCASDTENLPDFGDLVVVVRVAGQWLPAWMIIWNLACH